MGTVHRQVILVGGGIAGLWALRSLVAAGYDAILLEREAIGAGQTLGSQGILHGGVKYGLDGTARDIAAKLRALPPVWQACLEGDREPRLSGGEILSRCQHLWAADSWLAKVGATVGVRAMQGEVRKLERGGWPEALREGGHQGSVYELGETVIEVRSVLAALAGPVRERIFRGEVDRWVAEEGGQGLAGVWWGGQRLTAEAFIFAAGTGNEAGAAAAGFGGAVGQRRPLKQVMVRGPLPRLYGHCVTAAPKPVVTITAHPSGEETVWYLGGGVAEEATGMADEAAMRSARQKLAGIFPSYSWEGLSWACWQVDRAEPNAANRLPDGPALVARGGTALAWPSKLVYAPSLAEEVLGFVARRLAPGMREGATVPLPRAELGRYPWETADWLAI